MSASTRCMPVVWIPSASLCSATHWEAHCRCPIMCTVMRDPHMTEVGNTYERESIQR